jgi:hypothetical protein
MVQSVGESRVDSAGCGIRTGKDGVVTARGCGGCMGDLPSEPRVHWKTILCAGDGSTVPDTTLNASFSLTKMAKIAERFGACYMKAIERVRPLKSRFVSITSTTGSRPRPPGKRGRGSARRQDLFGGE